MVGIAKRLEEIYSVGDPIPLHIDKKSPALILIQRCRDEAHRFAITYHRNLKRKGIEKSELDLIDGIGETRKKILLKNFESIRNLHHSFE